MDFDTRFHLTELLREILRDVRSHLVFVCTRVSKSEHKFLANYA